MNDAAGQQGDRDRVNQRHLSVIQPVLERYRPYWPLTPRQIYYQTVREGGAGPGVDEFASFSETLRAALIEGLLPLAAVSEQHEDIRGGGAWEDTEEFVHSEIESFLWGYRRDLLQGQERRLEVWVQKPGLMDLIAEAAVGYCVTAAVCQSLPTVRFMQELRTRLEESRGRSHSTVILFFGDYVPGKDGFLSRVQETLRTDGNLWEMEFVHEALTVQDVVRHGLPESLAARAHEPHGAAEPGRAVVELEALAPDILAERVRSAIESRLDMELLHNQRAVQERESLRLTRLRSGAMRQMRSVLKQLMPGEEG
jgi:hypothetical protein